MATGIKFGLIARNTKESGKLTRLMASANLSMLTATFTRVNGAMTKLMDTAPTHTQTELLMSVNGLTINNMGRVLRPGQTVPSMMDSTSRAKSMGVALLPLLMDQFTSVTSK